LPASNETLRQEVLDYLGARFGIPPTLFAAALFTETTAGEVWVSTDVGALSFVPRRPPGLRALRRTPAGLKPTSAFLVSIGPVVTRSLAPVDKPSLRPLLLGRRIPCSADSGYVAIQCKGDVLGCGLVADATLHCLIPVGRRRELLDVLDVETPASRPEV
jgi:hypothetical protein